jgi:hypothetical protein
LPEGDLVGVLLAQHARIRDLFAEVAAARGPDRRQAFDELRVLLAVHETGEEMILRPLSRKYLGAAVADARDREEGEASQLLAALEVLDVASPAFDAMLAGLETAVSAHAEREEREEFDALDPTRSDRDFHVLGRRLRSVQSLAPTHPHPAVAGHELRQWVVGPFAAIVDRARDVVR